MNFLDLCSYRGAVSVNNLVHSGDGNGGSNDAYVLQLTVSLHECQSSRNKLFYSFLNGELPDLASLRESIDCIFTFKDVVYFEMLDESYADFPEYEDQVIGSTFRTYRKSGYLNELREKRLAHYLEDKCEFQHYSIYGVNHILEIVTFSEPHVEVVL